MSAPDPLPPIISRAESHPDKPTGADCHPVYWGDQPPGQRPVAKHHSTIGAWEGEQLAAAIWPDRGPEVRFLEILERAKELVELERAVLAMPSGPCTHCGGDHWRPDCPRLRPPGLQPPPSHDGG